MTYEEKGKKIAEIFARSRYDAGKTQEYVAEMMNVSKRTIANWESGTSCPTMLQFSEWFTVLNLNPMPYLLSMLYPKRFQNTNDANDQMIENAFAALCSQLPISEKRALMFIFTGKHGSSAHSLIQLLLAHIHTPLTARVTQADSIINSYELHRELDMLICKDDILPDMEDLQNASKLGRIAVMNKEYGYNIMDQ